MVPCAYQLEPIVRAKRVRRAIEEKKDALNGYAYDLDRCGGMWWGKRENEYRKKSNGYHRPSCVLVLALFQDRARARFHVHVAGW